jgi:hemoglobin
MDLPVGQQPSSPSPSFGPNRTPYDAIGGEPAVRALTDRFYDLMHARPEFSGIRRLHQPDLTEARQKLFEFLCGWLGGPELYLQKYGHPRLRSRHMPFAIGEDERDQWMTCMTRALDDCGLGDEVKAFLRPRFQQVADFMRNR